MHSFPKHTFIHIYIHTYIHAYSVLTDVVSTVHHGLCVCLVFQLSKLDTYENALTRLSTESMHKSQTHAIPTVSVSGRLVWHWPPFPRLPPFSSAVSLYRNMQRGHDKTYRTQERKKGRNVVSYLPNFSASAFFWGFIIQLTRTHRTGTKFAQIQKR